MNVLQHQPSPIRIPATIPNGQSMCEVVDLDAQVLSGIRLPNSAGWTSANLTFMVSCDGGKTFADLYKDGSEYTITVPTGRTNPTFFAVPPQDFVGFSHIRVRSGTAATPVNQGGDREIQIGRLSI